MDRWGIILDLVSEEVVNSVWASDESVIVPENFYHLSISSLSQLFSGFMVHVLKKLEFREIRVKGFPVPFISKILITLSYACGAVLVILFRIGAGNAILQHGVCTPIKPASPFLPP
ncbi:hypothetical protein BTVI_134417 [Pitangus sulphuratus]|nr:hypothetical protein BTVI_134417 [Pitangus sulphuratus]